LRTIPVIVATVTGDGTRGADDRKPVAGSNMAAAIGYRITNGWTADLFVDGTLGPQPVGNTIHGGVGIAPELLNQTGASAVN
jgi:hypothetical protein